MTDRKLRVLFVLEGNSDIRFISGLSEICDLSLVAPARQFRSSGLKQRLLDARVQVKVEELDGDRVRYQLACFRYLWRNAARFDLILSQELLRGTLNCGIVGRLRSVPVVAFMAMPPIEYFRCRRFRGMNSWLNAMAGELTIRTLLFLNGKLVQRCVALGPYLIEVASKWCKRTVNGLYYGVDTELFKPASPAEVRSLRTRLQLPPDKFLILTASRISHEKDPETVLEAAALARKAGLDAVVLSLAGGYKDFLALAERMFGPEARQWVLAREAAHPMGELADYYRAADCLAQGSLEEGAGMAPLEALACGVPAVCTAVGGLARILPGHARLTPKQEPVAMSTEFLWIAANVEVARSQALQGRKFVKAEWSRSLAFEEMRKSLESAALR